MIFRRASCSGFMSKSFGPNGGWFYIGEPRSLNRQIRDPVVALFIATNGSRNGSNAIYWTTSQVHVRPFYQSQCTHVCAPRKEVPYALEQAPYYVSHVILQRQNDEAGLHTSSSFASAGSRDRSAKPTCVGSSTPTPVIITRLEHISPSARMRPARPIHHLGQITARPILGALHRLRFRYGQGQYKLPEATPWLMERT